MPDDMKKKDDIRIVKTEEAMYTAMFSLLRKHSFKKIAVKDICEESLISRATFYTRFADKYQFLKWWIVAIWPDVMEDQNNPYEVRAQKINQFIENNKPMIKNLLFDADIWTLDALFDVLCSLCHLPVEKMENGLNNPKYVVISNLYIGGMIQYMSWQVNNNVPHNASAMSASLQEVMEAFQSII